jgi:hypothetical protein
VSTAQDARKTYGTSDCNSLLPDLWSRSGFIALASMPCPLERDRLGLHGGQGRLASNMDADLDHRSRMGWS